jgi:hypothetical protein
VSESGAAHLDCQAEEIRLGIWERKMRLILAVYRAFPADDAFIAVEALIAPDV